MIVFCALESVSEICSYEYIAEMKCLTGKLFNVSVDTKIRL